jgi:hypothetical protein
MRSGDRLVFIIRVPRSIDDVAAPPRNDAFAAWWAFKASSSPAV